jgi:hypothetical protein
VLARRAGWAAPALAVYLTIKAEEEGALWRRKEWAAPPCGNAADEEDGGVRMGTCVVVGQQVHRDHGLHSISATFSGFLT